MTHTPTPWKIGFADGSGKEEFWIVGTGTGGEVAVVHGQGDCCQCGGIRTQENAEFIVRAANAHDDLLAALKEAQSHLEYCGYGDRWERECAVEQGLEQQILKAIEKAEGD